MHEKQTFYSPYDLHARNGIYICPLLFDLSGSVQTRDCLSNNFYNKNSKLGRGEERGGEVVRIKLTVFTEY